MKEVNERKIIDEEDDTIIIGGSSDKSCKDYWYALGLRCEVLDKIYISATQRNMPIAERMVKLASCLGLRELSRKQKNIKLKGFDAKVTLIELEKIPSIRIH